MKGLGNAAWGSGTGARSVSDGYISWVGDGWVNRGDYLKQLCQGRY